MVDGSDLKSFDNAFSTLSFAYDFSYNTGVGSVLSPFGNPFRVNFSKLNIDEEIENPDFGTPRLGNSTAFSH